jgi:hypothetical protein
MQNSIEDHDLLSLIEDLPMSGYGRQLWKAVLEAMAVMDGSSGRQLWKAVMEGSYGRQFWKAVLEGSYGSSQSNLVLWKAILEAKAVL